MMHLQSSLKSLSVKEAIVSNEWRDVCNMDLQSHVRQKFQEISAQFNNENGVCVYVYVYVV